MHNWGGMHNRSSMMGYTAFLNDGIETVDFVSGVCDFTDCTVWFGQWIASMNNTVGQWFFLVLVVTGVWIADAIAEAESYQWKRIWIFGPYKKEKKMLFPGDFLLIENLKNKFQKKCFDLNGNSPIVWIWIDGLVDDVFGNNWSMGKNWSGMHNRTSMN